MSRPVLTITLSFSLSLGFLLCVAAASVQETSAQEPSKEPIPKLDAKSGAKPRPKLDAKSGAKPRPKLDAKSGAKPRPKLDAKLDAKIDAKSDAKINPKSDVKAATKPVSKPAAVLEINPVSATKAAAKQVPVLDTKTAAEPKPGTKLVPVLDTKTAAEPKPGTKLVPVLDTKTAVEPKPAAKAAPKLEAKTEIKAESRPEKTPQPKLNLKPSSARFDRVYPGEDPTPPERQGSEIFTEETPAALLLQAKQLMRHHNYNKAIKLLRVAIKKNDDDMDIRVLYAEALDEKLSHMADKDPEIFNDCIKSWLIVARQEVGEEKGMTFKGIGFMSGQYADEDWATKAKKRLKFLTGYSPKMWETDDRFLKKVLKPAETSVSAVIRSSDYPEEKKPARSKSKIED